MFRLSHRRQRRTERRSSRRVWCSDLVTVAWIDEAGNTRVEVAALRDVSLQGIGLLIEAPFHTGTVLHISTARTSFTGAVLYCRSELGAYGVGVRLSPGSEWSERSYRPAHMLDPDDLPDS